MSGLLAPQGLFSIGRYAGGFSFDGVHVLRLGRYDIDPSCFAVSGINYA
jgi:hypothetical protein